MVWCTTPKLATVIMLGFGNYQIVDRTPIYKQIVDQIETSVMSGKLKPGDQLPSMKEFALMYDISKETVKKAYGILVRRGLLESSQGKGFFVRSKSAQMRKKVLLMVDNLSAFKQVFVNSFLEALGNKAEAHILVHNNDVDLFRYYLDQSLGKYDIYVIMPHFPRDEKTIKEIEKQMLRIPSRQLILADMLIESLPGDFGAVYQDFYDGMMGSLKCFRTCGNIHVWTCLPYRTVFMVMSQNLRLPDSATRMATTRLFITSCLQNISERIRSVFFTTT